MSATSPDMPLRLRKGWHGIWTREEGHSLSYGALVLLLVGWACLSVGLLAFTAKSALCPMWIVLPDGRVVECP